MALRRTLFLLALSALLLRGAPAAEPERLGTVSFPVTCKAGQQGPFNRGVALLHDFWYDEARAQFERILAADPRCAMAHWGVAMSVFHQIWDRPDDEALAVGEKHMKLALGHPAATAREQGYIDALAGFYRLDERKYPARIADYAKAMALLHERFPDDLDAAAFHALAILAAEDPDDTSLRAEREALGIVEPLFQSHPEHPGVVHYIIHAGDTPALAAEALPAANRYGVIAASAPHAVHMAGHIYARLGMWREDIASQLGSIEASHAAEARHMSGAMDQFHSDDFLSYAYLQAGEDARAREVLKVDAALLDRLEADPHSAHHSMPGMFAYHRAKLPVFYHLEMRDWPAVAALQPVATDQRENQLLTYWAWAIAAGYRHQATQAQDAIDAYEAAMAEIRKGRHAYYETSTFVSIQRDEMQAWAAFAAGNPDEAQRLMRRAADLQDRVGQGEVDIPAREMLADILVESGDPRAALVEYDRALALSPRRLNGLVNAGIAAERAGDQARALKYYEALMQSTNRGIDSSRADLVHARDVVDASTSR